MTVRVYRWDDASAPTLSGAAGALISVLDACLVNGYGAKAAAGWTKPYSGTNLAAYLQGTGGNGHYLRVDASGTSTARVVGYESMSAVSTGTNAFPTETQLAGGAYVFNSSTTDSTARPWVLVATATAFYLWSGQNLTTAQGLASTGAMPIFFFGNITTYKTGDAYHTALIAGNNGVMSGQHFGAQLTSMGASSTAHWIARSYTQTGTCVTLGKSGDYVRSTNGVLGTAGATYPDPVTGGLLLSPLFLTEAVASITRGVLPGCWAPLHNLPANPGDTLTGTGDLAGKTFLLLDCSGAGTRARVVLEISDTW